MVWDAFKATTRGIYRSAKKTVRTEQKHVVSPLQDKKQECAHAHANTPSPDTLANLLFARRALDLHYQDIASSPLQQRTECIFEKGDKNGKQLGLSMVVDKPLTVVLCISSPARVLLTDRDDILHEFFFFHFIGGYIHL